MPAATGVADALGQMVDPAGRTTILRYTGGQLTTITDFAGRKGKRCQEPARNVTLTLHGSGGGCCGSSGPVLGASSSATVTITDSGQHNPQKHGNALEFNTDGLLTARRDRLGNQTTFSYSGGQLDQIVDTAGRTTSFNYAGGRLQSVTDRPVRVDETVRRLDVAVQHAHRRNGFQACDDQQGLRR